MNPVEKYIQTYRESHTHPLNHLFHLFGIPMIVVSLPLFFWNWRWALALFVVGWIFQFIGHWIEGKPPAFFKNPTFLLIGPLWWVKKLFGLEGKPNESGPKGDE